MLYVCLTAVFAATLMVLSVTSGGNFPAPLDQNEENRLFIKFKEEGDLKARETLILHNQRLVAHIVRKYYGGSKSSEDLVSIGTIGLIKAVDSFNYKSTVKFATYGSKCIQNEILMYFRTKKKQSLEVSMNETIDIDKDGNPLTYMDIIKIDDTIADDLDRRECSAMAMYYIENELTERERIIIKLRYGLLNSKPITQREVSQKLGISRSYVSRIEKSALEKIRRCLK